MSDGPFFSFKELITVTSFKEICVAVVKRKIQDISLCLLQVTEKEYLRIDNRSLLHKELLKIQLQDF